MPQSSDHPSKSQTIIYNTRTGINRHTLSHIHRERERERERDDNLRDDVLQESEMSFAMFAAIDVPFKSDQKKPTHLSPLSMYGVYRN